MGQLNNGIVGYLDIGTLNNATIVHKLQWMPKDMLIIASLTNMFQNWEHTILSHVQTPKGFFLLKDIDMDKSFTPSDELKVYFKKIRLKETKFLTARKKKTARILR